MTVDAAAAERFIETAARVLERHRLAVLLHDAPNAPVLAALAAYRNADGGFGHALEPDVRAPHSEPAAALHALHVLAEVGAPPDPALADWIASIAEPDGAVPSVLPAAADHPHAPWMVPQEGGMLTFALAGALWHAGGGNQWLERATAWCWARLERPAELGGYAISFALDFLDHVPDAERAAAVIETLRPRLDDDGSIAVQGGVEGERLTPLTLSARPGLRSRALFSPDQIEADLDRLERGQRDDGGWMFEWLAWSPGQEVEWRGALTVLALATLKAHGRL